LATEATRSFFVFPDPPLEPNVAWYRLDLPITDNFADALLTGDSAAWRGLLEVTHKLLSAAADA
jgi:hypothetical protein